MVVMVGVVTVGMRQGLVMRVDMVTGEGMRRRVKSADTREGQRNGKEPEATHRPNYITEILRPRNPSRRRRPGRLAA